MPGPPFILLDRVSTESRQGRIHLNEVSLAIERGEAVALVGPNGGGKTTILRLIAGIVSPVSGRVLVEGREIGRGPYEDVRKHRTRVGFVFEAGSLLANRTVRDNIALPFEYHDPMGSTETGADARVHELADELGIEEGLDAVGAAIHGSLGRAALYARALVLEPDILLVDEPQASLSPRQRARVSAAIERRRRSRAMTVLYADHDGTLAPFFADRRVYVVRGRLDERPSSLGDDAALFDEEVSSRGAGRSPSAAPSSADEPYPRAREEPTAPPPADVPALADETSGDGEGETRK